LVSGHFPVRRGGEGRLSSDGEFDGKALPHLGQWESDAGGRGIFEPPDRNDFFDQRLVDEEIEKYRIFK
jgi:hypothetical protein